MDPNRYGFLEKKTLSPENGKPKRSKFKRARIKTLLWCANAIRENGEEKSIYQKITREVALSLFSTFYGGTLLPKRQEHWEKKLGVDPGTFTRYNATRGQVIFTGLEYFGVFKVFSPLIDLIPGAAELKSIDSVTNYAFWASTIFSTVYNLGVRYPLSLRGKRSPPLSLYAGFTNSMDLIGRGISYGVKQISGEVKDKFNES